MYFVLAYYNFKKIADPKSHIKKHKDFLSLRDAKARIYINEDGVNAQMSIREEDAESYIEWLREHDFFKDMPIKIHQSKSHVFAKLTVKYRKELVAIDAKLDMSQTGEHVSPKMWKEMLEQRDEDTILLDVRNDYEWKVGHFDGAILPKLETFRDFKKYIDELSQAYDRKKTKVMMYCTGGIRCEVYSCLMKEKGFDHIFQLQGGVIQYGLDEGNEHWKGKLFVFDDRLVVPISQDKAEAISQCHCCHKLTDAYYNCANMDCNKLYISCVDCARELKGCCSTHCMQEPRVREFELTSCPKPFRKLEFEKKCELNKKSHQDIG